MPTTITALKKTRSGKTKQINQFKLHLDKRSSKRVDKGLVINTRGAVWKRKRPPYTVGVDGFLYADISCSTRQIDPQAYLPFCYDLVDLIPDTGGMCSGWWDGMSWISRKLGTRAVVKWRRSKEFC